jgi:Holliday junction resolvase-like predicted endonuclease
MNSWHVGVAAEAMVAAQFARYGYDVSVQYGADQPEYDLIASRGDEILKVSVKGSKDGSWGLTQKYKKYHRRVRSVRSLLCGEFLFSISHCILFRAYADVILKGS